MSAARRGLRTHTRASRRWCARLMLLSAVPAAATFAAPAAAPTTEITWPRDLYNPQPRADDALLPLPCGGAMAFRWVAASDAVPGGVEGHLRALYQLRGPFLHGNQPALLLGKYEVTELQYRALEALDGDSCPAIDSAGRQVQGRVGWHDALAAAARWTRWLTAHAGHWPDCAHGAVLCLPRAPGKTPLARLPSEAEWAYAARGGRVVSAEAFAADLYPMPEGLAAHAWYAANSEGQPKPIGYRAANPLGLHDLYGNVEELMQGLYTSERFPGQLGAAEIRGGSIHTKRADLSAERRSESPFYTRGRANRAPDNGFRLLLDALGGDETTAALPGALPAPMPPGQAVGHLQVNTDVAADVRLDGRLLGRSAPGAPVEVTGLPAGAHRVELRAAGYRRVREEHRITADAWKQVAVVLQPQTGLERLWTADLDWADARLPAPGRWLVPAVVFLLLGSAAVVILRRRGLVPASRAGEASARATVPKNHKQKKIKRPTPIPPQHDFEPEMIALPGGKFWMGSPKDEPERNDFEGPRHRVKIQPFAIGKTAVTFTQ